MDTGQYESVFSDMTDREAFSPSTSDFAQTREPDMEMNDYEETQSYEPEKVGKKSQSARRKSPLPANSVTTTGSNHGKNSSAKTLARGQTQQRSPAPLSTFSTNLEAKKSHEKYADSAYFDKLLAVLDELSKTEPTSWDKRQDHLWQLVEDADLGSKEDRTAFLLNLHPDQVDHKINAALEVGYTVPKGRAQQLKELANQVYHKYTPYLKKDKSLVANAQAMVDEGLHPSEANDPENIKAMKNNWEVVSDDEDSETDSEIEEADPVEEEIQVSMIDNARKTALQTLHPMMTRLFAEAKAQFDQKLPKSLIRLDAFTAISDFQAEMVKADTLAAQKVVSDSPEHEVPINLMFKGIVPINEFLESWRSHWEQPDPMDQDSYQDLRNICMRYQLPSGWDSMPPAEPGSFPTEEQIRHAWLIHKNDEKAAKHADRQREEETKAERRRANTEKAAPAQDSLIKINTDSHLMRAQDANSFADLEAFARGNILIKLTSHKVEAVLRPNHTDEGKPIIAYHQTGTDDRPSRKYVIMESENLYRYLSEYQCGGEGVYYSLDREKVPRVGLTTEDLPKTRDAWLGGWGLKWVTVPREVNLTPSRLPTTVVNVWWKVGKDTKSVMVFASVLKKHFGDRAADMKIAESMSPPERPCRTMWEALAQNNPFLKSPRINRLLTMHAQQRQRGAILNQMANLDDLAFDMNALQLADQRPITRGYNAARNLQRHEENIDDEYEERSLGRSHTDLSRPPRKTMSDMQVRQASQAPVKKSKRKTHTQRVQSSILKHKPLVSVGEVEDE